jgi:hypothetical protein
MGNYTRLHTVETITNKERTVKVEIAKYQKNGTKRTFFVAEYEGKRIGKILYARKYDAKTVANGFLKYKSIMITNQLTTA